MGTKLWLLCIAAAFGLGALVGSSSSDHTAQLWIRPPQPVVANAAAVTKSEAGQSGPRRSRRVEKEPQPETRVAAETEARSSSPETGWPPTLTDQEKYALVDFEGHRVQIQELLSQIERHRTALVAGLGALRKPTPHPDGEEIAYSEDGRIRSRGTWRGNKRVGRWQFWYDNGNPESEGEYDENEKRHGLWKLWSGGSLTESTYAHGVLHGPYATYSSGGDKLSQGFYRDGKQDGMFHEWYESGRPRWSHEYHNNMPADGVKVTYHDNGIIASRHSYKSGELDGLFEHWYESGQKEIEETYHNGAHVGVSKRWSQEGNLVELTEYRAGKKHGVHRWWDDDGTPNGEDHWVDGDLHGLQTLYSDEVPGQKAQEATYVRGQFDGTVRVWHSNGKIHQITEYLAGLREGPETIFYDDGTKASEGVHHNDKRDGEWKFYKPDGTIWRLEKWKDGKQQP